MPKDIPMKILIASFTFPPNKDGVSEAASVMAAGFLAQGWEVEVATSPTDPARNGADWSGAKVHEFAIQGDSNPKRSYSRDIGRYRTFLEEGDWDVVIFHAYLWSLYASLDILDRIPAKKILVSHGFAALQWIRAKSFPWGLAVWLRTVCRALHMFAWIHRMDRTVYLSEKADLRGFLDHWIAKAVHYEGRRVIPNGVDPDLRGTNPDGFRKAHGIAENQTVFLCVANYSRRKDQGYAARAFRAAAIPNAVLIFIGSEFNSDSARFQEEDGRLSDREKPGRIIWLEKIDRSTTLDAFAACDIFVISSDHEAQPIALLEAMRESKSWIARDSGCISEMPGGVYVHTEGEMAEQMIHLASNQNLRTALGRQGRLAVEQTYNRQHYLDSYCKLVSEVTTN
jgi:glycosyltransferase involved in cell wall biosynthesis